jgi:hypothetical protein
VSYQQRLFDGYTVSHERGTIGSFQIEDEDIRHFRADDVVVLVVTASIAGGSYKHDASGDWVRTNKLTAHQVRVADGVMKEEIVEFYNLAGDQLPFVSSGGSGNSGSSGSTTGAPSSSGSTHVDPSVAAAGNTSDDTDEEDEDEEDSQDEQDFSPAGQEERDKVLATFLNEQSA